MRIHAYADMEVILHGNPDDVNAEHYDVVLLMPVFCGSHNNKLVNVASMVELQ